MNATTHMPLRDRTLALAGVFQAAAVTQHLAREGRADEADLAVLVRSLLVIDAIDTMAVYGRAHSLKRGLDLIVERQSTQADITNFEIARYVLSLSQLAGRLGSESDVTQQIGMRLKGVDAGSSDDNVQHDEMLSSESAQGQRFAALADIYSDTISKLTPQIVVHGERGHLGDPQIVDRVRTALFAGVRSAWLWQQLGGRKWHLVLSKGSYAKMARSLLASDDIDPDERARDTVYDRSSNDDSSSDTSVDPDDSTPPSDSRRDNVTNINRRR